MFSGCWARLPHACPEGFSPNAMSPFGPAALSLKIILPVWPGRGYRGLPFSVC